MREVTLLFTFFIIGFGPNILTAQTSTTPVYYRYFTVQINNINSVDIRELQSDRTDDSVYIFENSCSSNHKLLVAVDASYPKRIEEMKLEIKQLIQNRLPRAKITTTESVTVAEKNYFCE